MSKIFTWVSGLLTGSLLGFTGGIAFVSWLMVIKPDGIIEICEENKEQ